MESVKSAVAPVLQRAGDVFKEGLSAVQTFGKDIYDKIPKNSEELKDLVAKVRDATLQQVRGDAF